MTSIINELFNIDIAYPEKTNWIKSSDDVYTVELEFPGFSKKDVSVTVIDQTLTVKAEKGERKKTNRISLNNLVSLDGISSKMNNGLLTLVMPKKEIRKATTIKVE